MIFTCNKTISIFKFIDTDGKKSFPVIANSTGVAAYIEPIDEEIAITYEGEGAYENFRLMTGDTTIEVGDKISDGNDTYIVLGKRLFNSLVGTHLEALIQSKYD